MAIPTRFHILPLTVTAFLSFGAQAAPLCPEHLVEGGKFHMLEAMQMFDGPPAPESEALAKISGKTSSWDIAAMRGAGAEPQAQCSFRHTTQTLQVKVPATAAQCSFTASFPAKSDCQ